MKFCSKCGKELLDDAVICPGCGCSVGKLSEPDAPSFAYALLGFFIPIAGIILFFVSRDTTPLKAKSSLKGALTSIILSTVLSVLYIVLIFGLAFLSL